MTLVLVGWTDIFVEEKFLGNELWRWAALLGVTLGSFIVGKVLSFFFTHHSTKLREAKRLQVLDMLLAALAGPVTLLCLAVGLYLASKFMNLGGAAHAATQPATQAAAGWSLKMFWLRTTATIAVIAAGWFIYRLVDIMEFFMLRWAGRTETLLDDQIVPLVRKALRVLLVIMAVLFVAQNIFHLEIGPLLAGAGIGGLAFAFAAKDVLANLFGSLTLFVSRPFHIGERIKIGGYDGIVEEVGLRATRLRTLDGHLVTIPNHTLSTDAVENISRRPYIKRVLNVTVTYDTTPEKLQRGMDILKKMLEARKKHCHPDNPCRVFFSDFNADSLNIVVYYYFVPPDWWDYLAFTNDFNMELLQRFNDEGIEFAFPTQTLYVKQEDAPTAKVTAKKTTRARAGKKS